MIPLPGQLFYTTPIPVCLWFVTRNKRNGKFRDRRGETLFIDARKMGELIDRTHRELSDEEIEDDDEPFEEKVQRLTATLNEEFADSARPKRAITKNLRGLGYGN